MSAVCERCWADAYLRSLETGRTQSEEYKRLIIKRPDKYIPTDSVTEPRATPPQDSQR